MDHENHGPKLYNKKKSETAPDKFSKYQDEYEARGRPSSDKMQQVYNHNQTYPKMQKELDKRRSTGQVRVSDVTRSRVANSSRRSRRSKNITRGIKKRPKKPCTCSECLKLKIRENSKSSQFTNFVRVINRRVATEPCEIDSHPERFGPPSLEHRIGDKRSNKSNNIISPRPSNTSQPSGTSFCSSLHLDHEPMV